MSKLDLKLLAWASMWVVTSLTVVGNPGIRSCDMGRENEFDFGIHIYFLTWHKMILSVWNMTKWSG